MPSTNQVAARFGRLVLNHAAAVLNAIQFIELANHLSVDNLAMIYNISWNQLHSQLELIRKRVIQFPQTN